MAPRGRSCQQPWLFVLRLLLPRPDKADSLGAKSITVGPDEVSNFSTGAKSGTQRGVELSCASQLFLDDSR